MKLETSMATRSPQAPGRKPGESSTEFQLHKSIMCADKNVLDYTSFRLRRYAESVTDISQRMTLENIVVSYEKGIVAVAWKCGKPIYMNIVHETRS